MKLKKVKTFVSYLIKIYLTMYVLIANDFASLMNDLCEMFRKT